MKHLIGTILLSMALQGCITSAEFTGTGPVTLSDRQQSFFDDWAKGTTDRDSLYFFLVRGGSAYAVVCPETRAICRDSNEYASYQTCESKYGEGRCKLYGVYGDVVWQFDKPADPKWWNENRGISATREQTITGVDVRSVKIKWAGYSGVLTGSLHYRSSLRKYELTLSIPGETYCDGSAEFTRKTWTMNCRNGVSAKGTFRPLGKGKGSIGEGEDNKGNRVEFTVSPARS